MAAENVKDNVYEDGRRVRRHFSVGFVTKANTAIPEKIEGVENKNKETSIPKVSLVAVVTSLNV